MSEPLRVAGTFNFRVTLKESAGGGGLLGDGGFQEVSGLEVEMAAEELQEGGRNDGVVRLLGRASHPNLVLKRGMFFSPEGGVRTELWRWIQETVSGATTPRRYDGVVEVLDAPGGPDGRPLATWSFTRGVPVKVAGPRLDARNGEVAVEELHIAHEGLRLEG